MPTTIHQINCGDLGAVAPYTADQFGTGGVVAAYSTTPILTGLTNPAPLNAYKDARFGNSVYTFPDLTASQYQIRLHFFEGHHEVAGGRVFDVEINNVVVLNDYDIAGLNISEEKNVRHARIETFSNIAPNGDDEIIIEIINGVDGALISAIEVIDTTVADTTAPVISSVVATAASGELVNLSVTDSDNVAVTGRDVEVSATGANLQAASGASGWTNLANNVLAATYPHEAEPLTIFHYRARSRDAAGNASAWTASNSVTTPDVPRPFHDDVLFPAVPQGKFLRDDNTFQFAAQVGEPRLDASNLSGDDLGAKANAAQAALLATNPNGGTVYLPIPGGAATYTTPILIKSKIKLEIGRGTLEPNVPSATMNNGLGMPIEYEDQTELVGQGMEFTRILHNRTSKIIIKPKNHSGAFSGDDYLAKVTKGNVMRDFTLAENPLNNDFGSTDSAITTGNTHDQTIKRVRLDRIHCLGITLGGHGSTNKQNRVAQNVLVEACEFIAVASQMLNVVNGENIRFINSQFRYGGHPGVGVPPYTFVDLESNNVDNRLVNVLVQGNNFDNRWRMLRLTNGSLVPEDEYEVGMGAVATDGYPPLGHIISCGNPGGRAEMIQIVGNNMLGGRWYGTIQSNSPCAVFMSDIDRFLIAHNTIIRTGQAAFNFTHCSRGQILGNHLSFIGGGGSPAMKFLRCQYNEVKGNNYYSAAQGGQAQTESNSILETTDSAGAGLQNAHNHYDNRGFVTTTTGASCTATDRAW